MANGIILKSHTVTPIECLPDDCLLRPYDVALPWKDGTPEASLR